MPVILVNISDNTKKQSRYTIWKTPVGWIGLIASHQLVKHLFLSDKKKIVYQQIHNASPQAQPDEELLPDLQQELTDYFRGLPVNFHCQIDISWTSQFARNILLACLRTKPGQTISYRELARRAGNSSAARAAGSVMAKNRTPILIPCHRIVRSDGTLGNYSAGQGTPTKKLLLELESRID
jgi:methylated-DNA-[protein]-cysteine S-methyltransferase